MFSFILDIGKTNVKGFVLDQTGTSVWQRSMQNTSALQSGYRAIDVAAIEQWLISTLSSAAAEFQISAVNVSTHGACAVLLDESGQLVLPVMDYEDTSVEACERHYKKYRPDFSRTCSPALSAGLNLGKQLYWLKSEFPDRFAQAATVLFYPQYWVWRLSGNLVTEITSLGCHTDLWDLVEGDYSSLCDELEIRSKFPPLIKAWDQAGTAVGPLAREAGLPADCKIFAGVHDSNASFARYLKLNHSAAFTLVTTGTWIISMNTGSDLDSLIESKDMLANLNILGLPVACARYMGGREFDIICSKSGSSASACYELADLRHILDNQLLALPSFEASGPFAHQQGQLPDDGYSGSALATLYTALMIDYELELLKSDQDIFIGSASQKNPLLCQLLATLRPSQNIFMSDDQAGTVTGAWLITKWHDERSYTPKLTKAIACQLEGLDGYKRLWREAISC
jgi:sugar (pentulose or hexulose) kinase